MTAHNRRTMTLSSLLGKCLGFLTLVLIAALLFFFLILPVGTIMLKAFYNGDRFTFEYFTLLLDNDLQTGAILNSLYIGLATVFFSSLLTLPLAIINTKFD